MSANFFVPFLIEVEGILVTFVICNYYGEYQKLQLGSGFKPTNN
jgi:hypothetical protein